MNTKQARVSVLSHILRVRILDSEMRKVLRKVARLEQSGYSFENAPASLELLLYRLFSGKPMPFLVESYHVSIRGGAGSHQCEATLKIKIGAKSFHEVAEGNGPLNALDCALRQALKRRFKKLDAVGLTDFSVRMLNSAPGTAAKTSVLIESSNGEKTWRTMGVSQNVIEASLKALVDSFEYALV